jgi:hypothetical protein
MILLSRLAVSTPIWVAVLYMLVLGLGLGLVMQVLVLAAQNAVPYKLLGVATSGSTLFRQIGGAIGVSIFGAIFASRLATELAARLPAGGAHIPAAASPSLVHKLPDAVRQPYIEAVTAAITPIFLAAAGFAIVAFLLTWLLREIPLRASAAEGIGESFASPREDRSDRELERIISSIVTGRTRTDIYRRIVKDARVELTPAEAWLLGRLATRGALEQVPSRSTTPEEVAELTADLLHRGYLTFHPADDRLSLSTRGQEAHAALVEAGRTALKRIADEIGQPEEAAAATVNRLATSLLADIPRGAARKTPVTTG